MESEWVVLNGRFVPYELAVLPVEDRAVLFADSIYEVIHFYNERPFCLDDHLDRLEKSASAIRLELPFSRDALAEWILQCARRNRIVDGSAYVQLTRGAYPRKHDIPQEAKPNWFIITRPTPPLDQREWESGTRLISMPDIRWQYRSIKTTCLLGNILAKDEAMRQGADDAAFLVDGCITEATSANLFAWYDGCLWTYPLGSEILHGITRKVILKLADQLGLVVRETPLPLTHWLEAGEIFMAGTVAEIAPVCMLDGRRIGECPGKVTRILKDAFDRHKREFCGTT